MPDLTPDHPRELTADLIADREFPSELDLSPDGRLVVYTLTPRSKRAEHETSALWLAPVETAAAPSPDGARPARRLTNGLATDRLPRWSPGGRQIAFLSDRAAHDVAQLYVLPLDGGEARPLTLVANKRPVLAFAWSPDGRAIAFTSADEPDAEEQRRERERDDADVYGERWPYARLRLLTLATGDITTLVAATRHVTDFAWSPDGAALAYLTQPTPALESRRGGMTLERVSSGGDEAQVICDDLTHISAPCWSHDGRLLLFTGPTAQSERAAQSSETIYSVAASDAGSAGPRRLAFGDESCADGLTRPEGATWVVALEVAGLDTRLHWLDPLSGNRAPLLADGASGYGIGDWAVRALPGGGSALAIVRGAGGEPDEVWAARREGMGPLTALRRATTHGAPLAGIRFGRQEPFAWAAPDGLALDGLIIYPPNWRPGQGPAPMVTLVHGGPYWRWAPGFQLGWGNWAQWLALAGYVTLLPNPRGGQGHGEWFAAAARGDVGGADYADVISAIDAAIARGIADPDRLGIGGWSQGGFMAAWAVTQTSRFKAAVMGAGVSDWGMMALTSDVPDFEVELGGSAPWDAWPDTGGPRRHEAHSPITFARNVTTPTLILHGREDERVPVSQAIGFHRALRASGAPTELVIYPREAHTIRERAHQLDLLRRVRAWYDRWLTSPPTPLP